MTEENWEEPMTEPREAIFSFDLTFAGKVRVMIEPRPGESKLQAIRRTRVEARDRLNADPRSACAGEGVESVFHADTEYEFEDWA